MHNVVHENNSTQVWANTTVCRFLGWVPETSFCFIANIGTPVYPACNILVLHAHGQDAWLNSDTMVGIPALDGLGGKNVVPAIHGRLIWTKCRQIARKVSIAEYSLPFFHTGPSHSVSDLATITYWCATSDMSSYVDCNSWIFFESWCDMDVYYCIVYTARMDTLTGLFSITI